MCENHLTLSTTTTTKGLSQDCMHMNGINKKRFWIFPLIYREHFYGANVRSQCPFHVLVQNLYVPSGFFFLRNSGMVPRKPGDGIDCAPFVVRIITVLKQYHVETTHQFLACLGQYVRSTIDSTAGR